MQVYVSKGTFAALARLEVQVKLTYLLFGLFSMLGIFNMMSRTSRL
jgi:uncharacterized protein YhhL (DUF1145 family)